MRPWNVERVVAEQADLHQAWSCCLGPDSWGCEPGDEDREMFKAVVSTALTPEQAERVATPPRVYPDEDCVLAVHWHPEFVPMELIRRRIEATFPNREEELIIPTQHNQFTSYGPYTGAEVDCHAPEFNQKVQLLVHFESARLAKASALTSMLAHTFNYRSSQLYVLLEALNRPENMFMDRAVRECGADESLVEFVRIHACRLTGLLHDLDGRVPPEALKNRLVPDYFDGLRPRFNDVLINRAKALVRAVKEGVKQAFPLKYFYRATEIIEEVRAIGGGVVIPHPEQFWPVLLAGYDVDGVEVWNPQSQRYTEFLIRIISEKNQSLPPSRRKMLVFMGDDCHMGEKAKDPATQDPAKAARQIGVQPSWESLAVQKGLRKAGLCKRAVIAAYKERLAG